MSSFSSGLCFRCWESSAFHALLILRWLKWCFWGGYRYAVVRLLVVLGNGDRPSAFSAGWTREGEVGSIWYQYMVPGQSNAILLDELNENCTNI
jgi:hypothetical protein